MPGINLFGDAQAPAREPVAPSKGINLFDDTEAPEEKSLLGKAIDFVVPTGLRVGGAVVGSTVGAAGGPLGLAAGGALGSAAGETMAEEFEKSRGLRPDLNLKQVLLQGAIGAVPLGKAGSVLGTAAKGAVLGGTSSALTKLADDQTPSLGDVAVGAATGGALGAAGAKLAERVPQVTQPFADEVRAKFSPQTVSEDAQSTADAVRRAKAAIVNANALEASKFRDVEQAFKGAPDLQNIAHISEYERNGTFPAEPRPGYSAYYTASMDHAHDLLQHAYGPDAVGYIENYVRRKFLFGSPEAEKQGTDYLINRARTLSADRSPLRTRILDMPLDEALADMQARGIDVRPATTNPETLRQWSLANARQAAEYRDMWQGLKDDGQVSFTKLGERPPQGLTAIDEKGASLFYPKERGLGQYYATPDVARILNNAVSKGLAGSPTYDAIRQINNSLNEVQLGLSAFHLTGTALNAGISDIALGARQAARGVATGDLGAAASGVTKAVTGAIPGKSFASSLLKGRDLINDLKGNSSAAIDFVREKLNPAGGRLVIDPRYQNQAYQKMLTAVDEGRYGSAALKLPKVVVELAAKPLMEYAIPRVKLGTFMDLAKDIDARLPAGATPAMRQRLYAQAWDSVDNRFGQLVYDNLFWNRTMQDLAHISMRSVGWNLGTVRELGGGLKDAATGKLTDRVLYTAALPLYVGMLGALQQYVRTGNYPSELKDYFYPRTGKIDPATGREERSTLPTYMKDVYAYEHAPVATVLHKAAPALSMAHDLYSNETYFGDMIRNPEDPAEKQIEQLGSYLVKNILPFSVQQQQRSGGVEGYLGVTRAPASIERSDTENRIHDFMGERSGLTPEQRTTTVAKHDLREALRGGDQSKAQGIVAGLSKGAAANVMRNLPLTALQEQFKRLTLDEALQVYDQASPQERAELLPVLGTKVKSGIAAAPPENQPGLAARAKSSFSKPRIDKLYQDYLQQQNQGR
jgi:hypothetical protein